jgi:hypothetical protein
MAAAGTAPLYSQPARQAVRETPVSRAAHHDNRCIEVAPKGTTATISFGPLKIAI